MRRVISSLVCLAFAVSLHASVPSAPSARFNQGPASALQDQDRTRRPLLLTAAPADNISFYIEFYGTEQLPTAKTTRKGGFLHWFTSTVKKTAQKANFFN